MMLHFFYKWKKYNKIKIITRKNNPIVIFLYLWSIRTSSSIRDIEIQYIIIISLKTFFDDCYKIDNLRWKNKRYRRTSCKDDPAVFF